MTFGLKYPDTVNRILGMSGLYDIKRMTSAATPTTMSTRSIRWTSCGTSTIRDRLAAFRRQDIIMAIGRDDPMCDNNSEFSGLLWEKGIGNALRIWDGHAHDWPFWEQMVRVYLQGHD